MDTLWICSVPKSVERMAYAVQGGLLLLSEHLTVMKISSQ